MSSREDKQRGIREDLRFLASASNPGVSRGAGCLTASSFCALPRWLILTLGKETMTTCWKCCQTWIKTWKSYWKRWRKSQVGCFPRQGAFPLLPNSSHPPYTSEHKSTAFLTKPSLTTPQLLYRVTIVNVNIRWYLPPNSALNCFLTILCVFASYFCNWTIIFLRAEIVTLSFVTGHSTRPKLKYSASDKWC